MTHDFGLHARRELLDATGWYLADGGEPAAELFEMAVLHALRLLKFMPLIGRPIYASTRTWPLRDFPYTLVCRVKGKAINVIAVAHQSSEPAYWRGR